MIRQTNPWNLGNPKSRIFGNLRAGDEILVFADESSKRPRKSRSSSNSDDDEDEDVPIKPKKKPRSPRRKPSRQPSSSPP